MLYFDRPEVAGLIPYFADENDPRSFVEQVNEAYAHGGGWNEFLGFKLQRLNDKYALEYPEDPPMRELARANFRNQVIVLFQSAWLAVIEDNELRNVARID